MNNADKPAMPQSATQTGYACNYGDSSEYQVPTGMTKREMFSMHFMASWINHHGSRGDYVYSDGAAAESAVQAADALLAELEKQQCKQ